MAPNKMKRPAGRRGRISKHNAALENTMNSLQNMTLSTPQNTSCSEQHHDQTTLTSDCDITTEPSNIASGAQTEDRDSTHAGSRPMLIGDANSMETEGQMSNPSSRRAEKTAWRLFLKRPSRLRNGKVLMKGTDAVGVASREEVPSSQKVSQRRSLTVEQWRIVDGFIARGRALTLEEWHKVDNFITMDCKCKHEVDEVEAEAETNGCLEISNRTSYAYLEAVDTNVITRSM